MPLQALPKNSPPGSAFHHWQQSLLKTSVRASTDSGARAPTNRSVALLISVTALVWSLFQLWIAQPQLWFGQYVTVLNSSQTRPIHLMFAVFLAFLAYPAFKSSPRDRIPLADWALALIGCELRESDYFGRILPPDPSHLRWCLGDPQSLDPARYELALEEDLFAHLYDPLVLRDEPQAQHGRTLGVPVADLARQLGRGFQVRNPSPRPSEVRRGTDTSSWRPIRP